MTKLELGHEDKICRRWGTGRAGGDGFRPGYLAEPAEADCALLLARASRSFFLRRAACFLTLSEPLLCPIGWQ